MSTAKQDVEELMNAFIGHAEKSLQKKGEFYLYAAAMMPDGKTVAVADYEGMEEPPSQEIIDLLNDWFARAARSGEYKATAVFYDVRTTLPNTGQKSDAVAVALDHKDDYSVVLFYPYTINEEHVSFGELFEQRGSSKIFGALP